MKDPKNSLKLKPRKFPGKLTPWEKVQLARHPQRPNASDYTRLIFTDFLEIHGDRAFGDDLSTLGGFAFIESQPVAIIGQQKGHDTKENLRRNFGNGGGVDAQAHPWHGLSHSALIELPPLSSIWFEAPQD